MNKNRIQMVRLYKPRKTTQAGYVRKYCRTDCSTKKHFLRSRGKKRQWKTLIENNTIPLTLPCTKVYFDCILNGDSATDAPNLALASVFDKTSDSQH